ncbi:MAG: putative metal-binding motif-containing protein [Alphaproteobacteria bacterium]|nr:putative metal-binding motif-containing protein [Alphaproteobacteria bacterium]
MTRRPNLSNALLTALSLAAFTTGCKVDRTSCEYRGLPEKQWFEDRDRDGFSNPQVFLFDCDQPVNANGEPTHIETNPTDCDDLRPSVYPGATELCDGLDNNCNLAIDDGLVFQDFWFDEDGDGFGNPQLQTQACSAPPETATVPGDCNDGDAAINPIAVEICDGLDNDCDALVDDDDALPLPDGGLDLSTTSEWHPDADMDGWGDRDSFVKACDAPPGTLADDSDCNDADAEISPDAQEICDGIDNDCDQLYDDTDDSLDLSTQTEWFLDEDADGYGVPGTGFLTCTAPWYYAQNDEDCDDDDPLVLSGTATTWLPDADGDGFGTGTPSAPSCTPPDPTGWASAVAGEDCDDLTLEINPGAVEICDGIDNDCDELVDDDDIWSEDGGVSVESMSPWWVDADGDGYGDLTQGFLACAQPSGLVDNPNDCDDATAEVNPGQLEICNGGIDDDCNGPADDNDPGLDLDAAEIYVRDFDNDGWGDLDDIIRACIQPDGYVLNFGDCDDTNPFLTLPTTWWIDTDGDGQGAGIPVAPASCFPPDVGYVPYYVGGEADCAPDDPLAYSGPEICYDGIDQGCDGLDFDTQGTCDLDLPHTCDAAQLFVPLLPEGQEIEGDLSDSNNVLDPGFTGCTAPGQASGPEEILPVLVPDGRTLRVEYRIIGGDSALYVVSSCFSAASCLVGDNDRGQNGSFETVEWLNDQGSDQVVYIVLDSNDPSDARPYYVSIELLPVP